MTDHITSTMRLKAAISVMQWAQQVIDRAEYEGKFTCNHFITMWNADKSYSCIISSTDRAWMEPVRFDIDLEMIDKSLTRMTVETKITSAIKRLQDDM